MVPTNVAVNFIRKWLLGSHLSIGLYFAITIAVVDSRSSCKGCGILAALRGKNVLAMLLIADASILLLMIKDC